MSGSQASLWKLRLENRARKEEIKLMRVDDEI